MVDFFLAQALKNKQLLGPRFAVSISGAQGIILVRMEVATEQASNGDTPRVLRVIEGGDLKQWSALLVWRFRHMLENHIQQMRDVGGWFFPVGTHPAHFSRSVDGWKVQLLFRSVQGEHQVKHLFLCNVWGAILLIDFVDHNDGF